jgi:hypothetical protein
MTPNAKMTGLGRITDRRELGTKANKADIWRRLVKIAVEGVTVELALPEGDAGIKLYNQFAVGEVVEFEASVAAGFEGKAGWTIKSMKPFDEVAWIIAEAKRLTGDKGLTKAA